MGDSLWFKLLSLIAPGVFALIAYLFGRATKGAINQATQESTCKRVDALEDWQRAVMATLASHNTLHEGYARTLDGIQKELKDLNTNVSRLTGVLQAPQMMTDWSRK